MRKRISNIIALISIVSWVLAWNLWMFFGRETFEIGQAFAIFGFSASFYIVNPSKLSRIILIIATNQLADELFFNPFQVSWTEYLTITLTIYVIFIPEQLIKRFEFWILKTIKKCFQN